MERSRSWFIALYGSVFASLFGIVFLIMVLYRWHGYQYFPDWNSFVVGFGTSLSGSGYTDFVNSFGTAFNWLSDLLQNLLTLGKFGNSGWLMGVMSAFSLLLGGGPIMLLSMAMLVVGGLYITFLTVPLVASVAYIIGVSVTDSFIAGTQPILSYYDGVGYPPMEDWSFVTVPVARFFA